MRDYESNSLQFAPIKVNPKGNSVTWHKWNEKRPRVLQIKPHKEPPKMKVKVRNTKHTSTNTKNTKKDI